MRNKSILRKKFILKRKEITEKERRSDIIAERIIDSDFYKKAKNIGIYSALKDEVSTEKIITDAIKRGKNLYFPKVTGEHDMEFFKVLSKDMLSEGHFGVREPNYDENGINKGEIDLFIIPGVCFDSRKSRIGFGKGFYDKYLSRYPNVFRIGICFDGQIAEEEIETDENDLKADIIITENRIIK